MAVTLSKSVPASTWDCSLKATLKLPAVEVRRYLTVKENYNNLKK